MALGQEIQYSKSPVWNSVYDKLRILPKKNTKQLPTTKFSMRNKGKIFIAKEEHKKDLNQELPENDRCTECNSKDVELGSSSHGIPICANCCNADRALGISCSSSSSASTSPVRTTKMDNSSGRKRRRRRHRNKEASPNDATGKKRRRGGAIYRGILRAWIGRGRQKEGKLNKEGQNVKGEKKLSTGSNRGIKVRQDIHQLSFSERLQIWSLSSDFWLKAYCVSVTAAAALFWMAWWI